MRRYFPLLLAAIFLLILPACGAVPRPSISGQETAFVPPTLPPPPTETPVPVPTVEPTLGAQSAGPNVDCEDQLTFRSDVTIPDGTVVGPDSTLDKRWEVENSGNCNWDSTYRVRLIAGQELGAQPEQALYPARSGSRAVIRIVFKAPAEPGSYRSAWQAHNPQGEPFGDPFFIDIVVQ